MADDLNSRLHANPLAVPGMFSATRGAGAGSAGAWLRWSALAGFALVSACLLWFGWPRAEPMLELPVSRAPLPPAAPPPAIQLADGSTAQLHGASSALYTEEASDQRVRLRLVGGGRFDVVPNRERSFVVSNEQVVVRVLGTAFSLDPEGARTRVAVERGRVQVMWRSGAAILTAGEVALFPPENEPAFATSAAFDLDDEKRAHARAKRKKKHKIEARGSASEHKKAARRAASGR